MQAQLEPRLETRLAQVLMGELLRPRDAVDGDLDDTAVDIVLLEPDFDANDNYASYEVCEAAPLNEATPTLEFIRIPDPAQDFITTIKFAREAMDPVTARVAKQSSPYERIDIQHDIPPKTGEAQYVPTADTAHFIKYSTPYERIDVVEIAAPEPQRSLEWFTETDVIFDEPPVRSGRAVWVVSVLAGALVLGFGLALFAI